MANILIIKNICKIHPFYFLIAFISIFTGQFKSFVILNIIFFIHELGHIIGSILFKWKIDKIIVLPFGCLTVFKENLNKPLIEELIIVLLGPIFQLFTLKLSFEYNLTILIFNLLPIFPLDGSKILNIILNKIFCFKKSHLLTIFISFIMILLLIKLEFSLTIILIVLFLLIKIIDEYKNHDLIFNKFLLERYLYSFKFKRRKTISKIDNIYKDYCHIIKINGKYYTEKEILEKKFDNKR